MSSEKEKPLSERDLSILNLIFDPSEVNKNVTEATKPVIDEIDIKDQDEENSNEIQQSKQLEIQGVKLTESGELKNALEKFNEAIKIAPKRPSIYNNRAQLYRFMEKDICKKNSKNFLKIKI
jgi:tetratricopeptide (TPR) repeat protein